MVPHIPTEEAENLRSAQRSIDSEVEKAEVTLKLLQGKLGGYRGACPFSYNSCFAGMLNDGMTCEGPSVLTCPVRMEALFPLSFQAKR